MEEVIYIRDNKGAAPVWWNGSYADEVADQSCLLPITVMSFHINLSAIDHSEMASDINWFLRRFLALCAKALSIANYDLEFIYHKIIIKFCLRAWSGLSRVRHPHYLKINGASAIVRTDAPLSLVLESTKTL